MAVRKDRAGYVEPPERKALLVMLDPGKIRHFRALGNMTAMIREDIDRRLEAARWAHPQRQAGEAFVGLFLPDMVPVGARVGVPGPDGQSPCFRDAKTMILEASQRGNGQDMIRSLTWHLMINNELF